MHQAKFGLLRARTWASLLDCAAARPAEKDSLSFGMLICSPCNAEPGLELLCLSEGKTLTLGVILGVAVLLSLALACSSWPPGSCLHHKKTVCTQDC